MWSKLQMGCQLDHQNVEVGSGIRGWKEMKIAGARNSLVKPTKPIRKTYQEQSTFVVESDKFLG